jgi:hypothetical protein
VRALLVIAGAIAVTVHVWAAQPLPARLSQTGLYVSGTRTVAPANRPYAPQYALWTDGAQKRRWIRLPSGARIDAHDVDRWEFPVGTRLWKEFSFAGRKVETRMISRSEAGWSFAAYVWNDAQTDATLAPADGIRNAAEIAPGRFHAIPSRDDCLACHDNGRTVLGFTALQLSDDRDPHAPHAEPLAPWMVTLRTLLDEGRLANAPPQLAAASPRIPGDARTRAALGYLSANCGHCHNEESRAATVRYPLLMPAFASGEQVRATLDALRTRPTGWDLPHAEPGTTTLVRAGHPDASALLARMRSRRPSSQMPPLGTSLPDREAIDLVASWIETIPEH